MPIPDVILPFYKIWTDEKAQAAFWARVDRREPDECWEWNGVRHHQGYGTVGLGRKVVKAHRVSYFLANCYICPIDKILHKCDNPPCVNPAHLFAGTQADNVHDMMRKGRFRAGTPRFGEANPGSKLSNEQRLALRDRYAQGGISQKAVAALFGVTAMSANRLINHKHPDKFLSDDNQVA